MKKSLAVFLALTMIFAVSVSSVFAVSIGVTEPQIVVSSLAARVGETINVPVTFKNSPAIATAKVYVSYPSDLVLNSVAFNEELGGMAEASESLESPVVLNWVRGSKGAEGDFLFATLNFTVLESATSGDKPLVLTYENGDIFNIDEENINFEIESGKICVTNAEIVVSSVKAKKGDTKDITIALKNNPGISAMRLMVEYSSDLSPVDFGDSTPDGDDIEPDSIGTNVKKLINYNIEGGYGQQPQAVGNPLVINWISLTNVSGDVTFVTLKFKVADDAKEGEKSITVTYEYGDICNQSEEDVGFVVTNGGITVAGIVYGDANGDGTVSSKDVTRLKKYLADYDDDTGTSTVVISPGADANGDGTVSSKDVTRLKKYLANYDDDTGTSTVILGPAN